MRERMKSLRESIYEGIKERIREQGFSGFNSIPSNWEIVNANGGKFQFGGLQNVIDMKGSFNYKIFLNEEAARIKQKTLDTLGATLRGVENAELWYIWNPESYTDPMSTEFIIPYQAELDRQGYYEDDYHLIINVNFNDNPWFFEDSALTEEYEKDRQKLADGRMSSSRFNHIWHGAFSDDIETSIIKPDWFDACIDAHIKLGIEPTGFRVSALDPADVGRDESGYIERHGILIEHIEELEAANANIACDIACSKAKSYGANSFGWDGDGLGAPLRNQVERNLSGLDIVTYMYKGSKSPHLENAIFQFNENDAYKIRKGALNKDVFTNRKSQNILYFSERMRKTYEWVVNKKPCDPDDIISISSQIDKKMIAKFRAECCRLPVKPSDKIAFYSKDEMRRGVLMPNGDRIKIPSPNLLDAAVLSFDDDFKGDGSIRPEDAFRPATIGAKTMDGRPDNRRMSKAESMKRPSAGIVHPRPIRPMGKH
ncbi:hypothetical protein AB832_07285 [Flavobacteriaceae bacterium (ex Bugula neritina AB1)]|nr:hypothetical protein AB832_07285 [Flavobacteriaceae bacterium (ex Bugula neritina AB1)]